jgi:hypothetical protein
MPARPMISPRVTVSVVYVIAMFMTIMDKSISGPLTSVLAVRHTPE